MKKIPLRSKKTTTRNRTRKAVGKIGARRKPEFAFDVGATPTFSVKEFCGRFRIIRPDLKRLTGYSQRAVDQWAAGDKPSSAAQKQLREVVRLFDGLADIMEPDCIGEWLKTPNEAFDGSSPLQVIERGESDRIWRMIYQLQTGEPM